MRRPGWSVASVVAADVAGTLFLDDQMRSVRDAVHAWSSGQGFFLGWSAEDLILLLLPRLVAILVAVRYSPPRVVVSRMEQPANVKAGDSTVLIVDMEDSSTQASPPPSKKLASAANEDDHEFSCGCALSAATAVSCLTYVGFGWCLAKCIARLISEATPASATPIPWFWGSMAWALVATSVAGRLGQRLLTHAPPQADQGSGAGEQDKGQPAGKKGAKGSASIKQLLGLALVDWKLLLVALLCLIAASAATALLPKMTGDMVDVVAFVDGNSTSIMFSGSNDATDAETIHRRLNEAGLKLLLTAVACALFSGLRGSVFLVCIARLNIRVRMLLFTSLVNQEIGFFDTTKIGDMTSRLGTDTNSIADLIALNLNVFIRSFVSTVFVLVFMATLSVELTAVAFVTVPIIVYVSKVYGKYMKKISKATQKKLANANVVAEECLASIRTVRSFANEPEEVENYRAKMDDYYGMQMLQAFAYVPYASTWTLLPQLATVVVIYYGSKLVMDPDNRFTGGNLVSFLLYLQSLTSYFNSMGDMYSGIMQAVGAADKVFELIHRKPDCKHHPPVPLDPSDPGTWKYVWRAPPFSLKVNTKSKVPVMSGTDDYYQAPNRDGSSHLMSTEPQMITSNQNGGKLELAAVDLVYPARPGVTVLNGINVNVRPGEVVALVGPSGGGKSSVVSLIERFYDPTSGTVLFDDRNISEYSARSLHRRISIVQQEPVVFARTVRRNIIYGLEGRPYEPTFEQIMEAAKLANAHDFIMGLPEGYNTEVGERGVTLSGGQKQRLAIARALVREPAILLLDEATSALDAESEAAVQAAIDRIMQDRTVLIIAHRLSTIRNADRILVIQKGAVVEKGTHDQLLQLGGAYKTLVEKQLLNSGRNGKDASAPQQHTNAQE